jgi:hypothetical protein
MGVLKKYTLTGFIIAFGAGLFVPIMTKWFDYAYGIPDVVSGPVLGVSNILIGVTTLAAPLLARRLGIIKAIVTTQAFSTYSCLPRHWHRTSTSPAGHTR